jgi:crotonobetainyl-CoA:carnitine CoA-transferase CaiB-like acyl-CoA transferase
VVVENNSVGVLDKLGIGWEVLHARNPALICVRMPPMGLDGPYAEWLGFGAHFEALCGLTSLRGYPDLDPSVIAPVFHMDPATGVGGAFATVVALRHRARTGVGTLVEFSQAENMMQHIGEFLIDAARTGRRHGPQGNRSIWRAPQGCYPCAGTDRWVVIAVGDDAEWAGLVRAMGSPAWAADHRFATAAGRRAHHDGIDVELARWTAALDPLDVFGRCQAEGVPAAPVLDEAACLADPHLRARGFFRRNGSSDVGEWEFPNHLWRWDGPPMRWDPLCRLGADNDHVYREVLGLSDDEYGALGAAGHLSLAYLQPDGTPF